MPDVDFAWGKIIRNLPNQADGIAGGVEEAVL
jgi:hypothetical protein